MIKRHAGTWYTMTVFVYNKVIINYLDYLIIINDNFEYSRENYSNIHIYVYKKKM
jgi:hypothetical protein